jgi:hypothetical protein
MMPKPSQPSSSRASSSPWSFLLRYSMVHRTSVVVMIAVGFGLSIVAQLGLQSYRRHKEDLLSDFLIQKAKVIEARLQAHLLARSGAIRLSPEQGARQLKQYGQSALPEFGRIIVFLAKDRVFAAGWDSEFELWLRDMEGFRPLWEGGEEFSFLTDGKRNVLGSNKDFIEAAAAERAFSKVPQLFQSESKSPVQVVFGEELAFMNSAAVRIPVRGTNLVLYSETSVSGYMRVLRKLSGGMLSVFVFVAFTTFALAGFAANWISEGLSSILARYQLLEKGVQSPPITPSMNELSFLNEKFSFIAMKTRTRFLENAQSAGIKENVLSLFEKISSAQCKEEFLADCATSVAAVIEKECRAPSLVLYLFPTQEGSIEGRTADVPALRKMFLMLSGIRVAQPVFREVSNEGWNLEESAAFCGKSQSQLLSDNEVRFPVVCGDERIGFLLCSGQGVNTLSKMKLEWLLLLCDVMALGYVYLNQGSSGESLITA